MLRRDLIADGWNDRAIAAQIRCGAWQRIRHGAYVDARQWQGLADGDRHLLRVRAVIRQSGTDLVISHASGVPLHNGPTWGLDLSSVHGTRIDGKAGRREAGVRQHRGRILDEDLTVRHGVEVMSATRIGLEVTTIATSEASLVVINHLLHSGATTLELLRARYELGIHLWPHTLKSDLVLRRATDACESVGESRFWHLCAAFGLPTPVPQFAITDGTGHTRYRLDFAWPEMGVFAEFDGKIKYTAPLKPGESPADVVFREKRREDEIRELTGWICVRITWADLADPVALVARVRRAFDQAARLRAVS
jgi:hypothetical protein